jgi:hypothetical protein
LVISLVEPFFLLTLTLKTDNIEDSYEFLKSIKPKTISPIFSIKQPHEYKYFQFEDEWGNVWEVAEYDY